ncbi:Engulfment and cell motility protein 3 [Acipenser ruthenus]|uniref:Engulfment and cell motility protein 3 n=1 Tax=Acipenser ruthenus TaxID=7906 RepID=A0A444UEI1_ACIRT|nr:Engulfment and cell motility protein 3 [Acipenser ruthenus]
MPPQKDIVKIAIQMPGAYPQLIDLDQDTTSNMQTRPQAFHSKEDKIKMGKDIQMAVRCMETVLSCKSESDGFSCPASGFIASALSPWFSSSEVLAHALKAFMELMDHGIVSWENLSAVFIKKIAGYVSLKAVDASVQQLSLAILESMVLSSSSLFEQVQQEVTLEQLIAHLQVQNQQIQTKAMALLIALLQTAGDGKKREMIEFLGKKNLRQYINKNIIHTSGAVGDEMVHYLYVLQSVTLNTLEPKMRTPLDPYSQEQRDLLHGLRQLAFEFDSEASLTTEKRRSLCAKEFKKLGFSNNSNPGLDLNQTPPGLLALETMVYFSSRYPNAYSRFVLENSSREDKHGCPFARGSIQLTLILCEILRIGDPPSETGQDYYPLFFAQDRLLEELFCICIQLLNKTWKEMRATQEDFDKVMQVVREQITRTLSSKPTSLDLFKNKVNALNYSEILKLRQTERLHQEETLAPPVLELKERLKPELLELIRQQRLNRLCHGTLFRKISSRRRQGKYQRTKGCALLPLHKLWYCRLSPNHKVLHYGDVDEESETPPIEALQEKIICLSLQEVLDLAFTITYDLEEYQLNFVASSRTDFCLWTDGLNVLLGKDMTSECTQSELDILLSMEIKLRLLDLENIPIPDAPPPVPKPPSNLHFCYDFSQTEQ